MQSIKNFKFTLNVSNEGYQNKKEAIACLTSKGAAAINRKKMCFFEREITVDEFLNKAQSGHSFCALFRFEEGKKYWYETKKGQRFLSYPTYQKDSKYATKGGLKLDFKRDTYFSGTQMIFIDIDYTTYTDINEYINMLSFKPTCIYMSYSDNIAKHDIVSRRFHMCYAFDKILNSVEFMNASETLSRALEKDTNEKLEDKCGENKSQYMNGCFGNHEVYATYNIYSMGDIYDYIVENRNIKEDNNSIDTTINLELETKDSPKDEIIFDETLLKLYDSNHKGNDYTNFCKLARWNKLRQYTKYYYRVEKDEWINNQYQFIDESYFRLFWYTNSLHDGNKRRKGLFERMCLRKVMNPSITADELVVNTIIDIMRFYDNSDEVLNSDFIRRNVTKCLELSIEEIEDKYKGTLKYLREISKPKKGIIYRTKLSHSKETTYAILDGYYDDNLSVTENLDIINNDYGYLIKKSTLYSYLKSRNIKSDIRTLSNEELVQMVDINKSIRENLEDIKSLGYKISKDRINIIIKQIKRTSMSTTINDEMEIKDSMEIDTVIDSNVDMTVADYKSLGNDKVYFNPNKFYSYINQFSDVRIERREYANDKQTTEEATTVPALQAS